MVESDPQEDVLFEFVGLPRKFAKMIDQRLLTDQVIFWTGKVARHTLKGIQHLCKAILDHRF
jgi:hypothetical protein